MTVMKVKVSDLQPHSYFPTGPSMKMKKKKNAIYDTVLIHCPYKPPANFYFLFSIHTVADQQHKKFRQRSSFVLLHIGGTGNQRRTKENKLSLLWRG